MIPTIALLLLSATFRITARTVSVKELNYESKDGSSHLGTETETGNDTTMEVLSQHHDAVEIPSEAEDVIRTVSGQRVNDFCKYFYVRVPKTGSTTLHNMIMNNNGDWGICSTHRHLAIPGIDRNQNVGTYLVSIREPYERFMSQYKYSLEDFGQPGKAAKLHLGEKYSNINDFSRDLIQNPDLTQKAAYWQPMNKFVPIQWIEQNPDRVKFLCMSGSQPVHVQLGSLLGTKLDPFPHQNENAVIKENSNTTLSDETKQLLAETFLKQDIELYRRSGCADDDNGKSPK